MVPLETPIIQKIYFCNFKDLYELLDKREKSADPLEGGSILPFFGQLRITIPKDVVDEGMATNFQFSPKTVFVDICYGPKTIIRAVPFEAEVGQESFFDWDIAQMLDPLMLGDVPSVEAGSYFDCKTSTLYKSFMTFYSCKSPQEFPSVRSFSFAAIHWNSKSRKFKLLARSTVRANDMALLRLPVSTALSQVRQETRTNVHFFRERRHIFALLVPALDVFNSLLVYVCWKGEFVPVAGNYKDYPGLHVFPTNSFFVKSENFTQHKQGLFLGTILPHNEEGSAQYELARICLRW